MNSSMLKGSVILGAVIFLSSCMATRDYVDEQVQHLKQTTSDDIIVLKADVALTKGNLAKTDAIAQEALQRAIAAGVLAEGKFVYDKGFVVNAANFDLNKSQLDGAAAQLLTEIVEDLRTKNKNVYIEIQGHTDDSGSHKYNLGLGIRRAQAVRDYMASLGVPLNRMDVISYGESSPISDIAEKNRRVVVQVME